MSTLNVFSDRETKYHLYRRQEEYRRIELSDEAEKAALEEKLIAAAEAAKAELLNEKARADAMLLDEKTRSDAALLNEKARADAAEAAKVEAEAEIRRLKALLKNQSS